MGHEIRNTFVFLSDLLVQIFIYKRKAKHEKYSSNLAYAISS